MRRVTRNAFALVVLGILLWGVTPTRGQTNDWSTPLEISDLSISRVSWFPDATVGPDGTLFVVWCSFPTRLDAQGSVISIDSLMYRELRGDQWSAINDIFSNPHAPGESNEYTVRSSIAVGRDGRIHVLFRRVVDQVHFSAPLSGAQNARSWSLYKPIAPQGGYYNALAMDSKATLHALWTPSVADTPARQRELCPNCANLFYRRSMDGGNTWSLSLNLSRDFQGANRPQIAIDQHDRIHIVWDEGFDWYAGSGQPQYGVYIRSDDGGSTWSTPVVFSLQGEQTYQTTLAVTPEGNPFVVYRTVKNLYYQSSSDGGTTWSLPAEIPNVQARNANDPNLDRYSAAFDGAGQLHLLAVGFPIDRAGVTPSLMHLTYDGHAWGYPEVISADARYPEWPRLAISGSVLHAVWFTRETLYGENVIKQVWHSSKQIQAPPVAPIVLFTPTPLPLPTAVPTTTPLPTPLPDPYASAKLPTGPPEWERPAMATLGAALLPPIFLLALVIFIARRR